MLRHPLEDMMNASASDILTAIQRGFRAQVDVKGKLAELFMDRLFGELQVTGRIDVHEWQDVDGKPDFIVHYKGHGIVVECKNVRNTVYKRPPSYKVELQKTRNSMDGTPTRGYKMDEFDVLGVSLFNQTGEWNYYFIATKRLERRAKMLGFLTIMQRVPIEESGYWCSDPIKAFDDALNEDVDDGTQEAAQTQP